MFLDERYLLGSSTALRIFSELKNLPIIDMHNHADVKAIAENRNFSGAWQLFGATDHYVWEVMRKAQVNENLITGAASDHDKFIALAEVCDDLAGNPVYEWIHLDLKFLGVKGILSKDSGERIYNEVNQILQKPENRPMELLKRMKVEVMCSTDDPVDLLLEHEQANKELAGACMIRPTWRPDKAVNIRAKDFADYINKVAKRFGRSIKCIDCLIGCLQESHDYFAAHGCKASDHGFTLASGGVGDKDLAQQAFAKAMKQEALNEEEIYNYSAYLFGALAEMNVQTGWVTQLHVGAVRNVRDELYRTQGADSGGDVNDVFQNHAPELIKFLNRFDGRLKSVLYCLDPGHQSTLAGLSRAFGHDVHLGSAWWLCDTPIGMKRQLEYIGNVDVLSNFAGMVSDSRKLLSYGSRFEMFRRVLADVLGEMVDLGRMPEEIACRLAKKMCYDNPQKLFDL